MILLDTHVVLWWLEGGGSLSAAARQAIEDAQVLLVSPVTCWEVGTLVAKRKVALDRDVLDWTADLYARDRIDVAALTPSAAARAGALGLEGFHGDPADRLLYATARELGVPLVTRDRDMTAHASRAGDVRIVW